jgi:SAM-dependent methyltransferase
MDPRLFDLHAKLEQIHWWFTARARIIRTLAERVAPDSPKVVEVGCGTGGVLAGLPKGWERVGLDLSQKAIDVGRTLYGDLDLRVVRGPSDVHDEVETADLVLLCDVLEHVEDDKELFSSIVQALPERGQLLLTVPAHPHLWSAHDVSHGHIRRYTLARLKEVWESSSNLEVRLLSPFNWRLYSLAWLVRRVARLRGTTERPDGPGLSLPPGPLNAVLRSIFLSEATPLLARLDGSFQVERRRGLSWIAVLRKSVSEPLRATQRGTGAQVGL